MGPARNRVLRSTIPKATSETQQLGKCDVFMFIQNQMDGNMDFKKLRFYLVKVIWVVPLGQGVANSSASWIQTATVSEESRLESKW